MRYIIGVDLGTTNSCVAYIDTDQKKNPYLGIQQFRIPQLSAPFSHTSLPVLPSFCYLSESHEWQAGALKLPWNVESPDFVGKLAVEHGSKVPTRLVQSAKSWLCHSAAHRKDKILPVEGEESERKISPVEATARYLKHIKEAWNHVLGEGDPLNEWEHQSITITVPASFDQVARTLTAEAAKMAGFTNFSLLEEPQAAFYSWIAQHPQETFSQFSPGHKILVCDVGGGTTDFSLIEVQKKGGELSFIRNAVGNHLLLGGDNMDLAIAHLLEKKFQEQDLPELNNQQWLLLKQEARNLKEVLLEENSERTSYSVFLQGTGSSIVKGSISTEVSRKEILDLLINGFFGQYEWHDAIQIIHSGGFKDLGLPYEEEPSITKHLASFLEKHKIDNQCSPDFVLFNGGAMKPRLFQKAIIESIHSWFPDKKITVLPTVSLDLAVARGAAYFGKTRHGMGLKIGGGTAVAYYLELANKENQPTALTLVPRETEEGSTFETEEIFKLQANKPVSFKIYTSHVRLNDKAGDIAPIDLQEMQPLTPIHTVLKYGKGSEVETIPVRLQIKLTEIGTLELWLKSTISTHKWSLEFQVRSASGHEVQIQKNSPIAIDAPLDEEDLLKAEELITGLYKKQVCKPQEIINRLEHEIGKTRHDWTPSILRAFWTSLLKIASSRKVSTEHEARWWNLAGLFLRPGFGYPLDDFKMKDFWKIYLGDVKENKSIECQIQQWICLRRIAGGLNKGQQQQIAHDLLNSLFPKKKGSFDLKGKGALYQHAEKIRAFASLELVDNAMKIKVADAILELIEKKEALPSDYWALGRIGARHLLYGSLANVISTNVCEKWIERLLKLDHLELSDQLYLFSQLARITDHREANIKKEIIQSILHKFPEENELKEKLTMNKKLSKIEQERIFGDELPPGLSCER